MSTTTIVIIVVAVVLVLAVVGLVVALTGKKRTERRRARAAELRSEAGGRAPVVHQREAVAREHEAEAQEKRAVAETAEARATESRQAAEVEKARLEDTVRTADRLDPDVDHKARDYAPTPVDQPAPGTPAVPASEQPPVDPDYDRGVPADPLAPEDDRRA